MKKDFTGYLQSLGFTDILLPKCNEIFGILSEMACEEVLDIFISEYIQEDGTRYYEDFRVFTETTCLAAKNFLHEYRLVLWNLKNRYENTNLHSTNYDYKAATDLSRLTIYCFSKEGQTGLLMKASRKNCDHLYSIIFKKHIRPNLAKQ